MKEFFGFGGYERTPEGYMSWQHLLFVSSLMIIMIGLAIFLGLRNRKKDEKSKNKILIWSAILIDSFEIFKFIIVCSREASLEPVLRMLPLFLCSIQLITIPLAAFARGRIKEAALDFVFIFGILGAFAGTYGAGQNYSAYPVLSFDNVVSGITHSISGFASLYIIISGMASMKTKNIWISFSILIGFCVLAYIADVTIPYNYMFLMAGDGTPYDIFYNLVKGNKVLYPMIVVILFLMYISVFYLVYLLIKRRKNAK
ncbi:MAG: YwaF family protein [Bacilli bacterium]|nr:YwaF family protein [Bacilli bacterium]